MLLSKLSWNKFIDKHGSKDTFAFSAPISASGPKGMIFDRNGRKLPTPYNLFSEWCAAYLSSDWSSTKVTKGFIVSVSDKKDALRIQEEFKIIGSKKITSASHNTFPIGYKNNQYATLAGDLGYVF